MPCPDSSSPLSHRIGLSSKAGLLLLFCFLSLGDFVGISQLPATINYNYLNSGLLYIAMGLLFWLLSLLRANATIFKEGSFTITALLVLIGFLSAIDFFVKFSSSVLFFGAALVLLG